MIENMISASASASGFEVREVCAALEISPSGFYAHRHKGQRPRRGQDRLLTAELQSAFEQSYGTYGSPRFARARSFYF